MPSFEPTWKRTKDKARATDCPSCSPRPHDERSGREPDDLLCSRNARPQKALVGCAQWKINQPPSLRENKQAWREHIYRPMRAVNDSSATLARGNRRPNKSASMVALPRRPLLPTALVDKINEEATDSKDNLLPFR